jgi:CRP-like cAMP-binding protein
VAERVVTHSLVKALRAVPDLAPVDDRTLLAVVGASANLHWAAGAHVFEKGASAEGLYVVLSGRVRIFDTEDGKETDVVTLGPGGFFGEHALLLEAIHSKTAQALEDTELLVVPKASFQELLAGSPELDAHFRRRLEEHLKAGWR